MEEQEFSSTAVGNPNDTATSFTDPQLLLELRIVLLSDPDTLPLGTFLTYIISIQYPNKRHY